MKMLFTVAGSVLFLKTIFASEVSDKPVLNLSKFSADNIRNILSFVPECSFAALELFPQFKSLRSKPHPLQVQVGESLGLKSLISKVPFHRDLEALGGVSFGINVTAEKHVYLSDAIDSCLFRTPIVRDLLVALAEELVEYKKNGPSPDPKFPDCSHLIDWSFIVLALLVSKKYDTIKELGLYFPELMKQTSRLMNMIELVNVISTALVECPECFQFIFQNPLGLANILCFANCPFEIFENLLQDTQVDLRQISQMAFDQLTRSLFSSEFDFISNALKRVAFLKSHFEHLNAGDWDYAAKLVEAVYGEISDVEELMNRPIDQKHGIFSLLVSAKKFESASLISLRIPVQFFLDLSSASHKFSHYIVQNHQELLIFLEKENSDFLSLKMVYEYAAFIQGASSLRDYLPICKTDELVNFGNHLIRQGLTEELLLLLQRSDLTFHSLLKLFEVAFDPVNPLEENVFEIYKALLDCWRLNAYSSTKIFQVPINTFLNLYLDPLTADLISAMNDEKLCIRATFLECEPFLADDKKYKQLLDIISMNPLLEQNVFDMSSKKSLYLIKCSPKMLNRLEVLVEKEALIRLIYDHFTSSDLGTEAGDILFFFIACNYPLMVLYFKLCPDILRREIQRINNPEAYAARLQELEGKPYHQVYLKLTKLAKSPDGPGTAIVFDSIIHSFFLQFIDVMKGPDQ